MLKLFTSKLVDKHILIDNKTVNKNEIRTISLSIGCNKLNVELKMNEGK